MKYNSDDAYNFLNSLINYERQVSPYYDFKLDKFRKFLELLDNPQDKLSNVIIIAGTKGKGSTATFIESALRGCGLKTGLYTSPHILSIRERIKFCGQNISENDFVQLVQQIKDKAQKSDITFFEAITAVAFLYFQKKKPDYTILEVGLGGRLDATNVVNPLVSVITRIGYDHTDILGKTLAKIAYEKAGIIHPNSYVVLSRQRPSALKVLLKTTKENHCQYCQADRTVKITHIKTDLSGSSFLVKLPSQKKKIKFHISMIGKHQIENVQTAIGVLNYLKARDQRITNIGIKQGLSNSQILCRVQVVSRNPLIIVDGAHNPESIQALVAVVKSIIKKKVIIIFGSSRGKLIKAMFKHLVPIAKTFILTQSQNPRHIPATKLALNLKLFSISYTIMPTVKSAIQEALNINPRGKYPIIITGSFYVASEALQVFRK